MRSSSPTINIAASAQRLDVDNRIPLRFYYRIADNILKQADIFRAEKNVIDLYVMLLRFSSLVMETIPHHQEYRTSPQSNKLYLKKKLLVAVSELEQLQPKVQQKLSELNRKHVNQFNNQTAQNKFLESPSAKTLTWINNDRSKALRPATRVDYKGTGTPQISNLRPVDEQFRRMSLNFPRPNAETLSRHSILGPSGLYGQWQPPKSDMLVNYPSSIDMTPVEIPRNLNIFGVETPVGVLPDFCLLPPLESGPPAKTECCNIKPEKPSSESISSSNDNSEILKTGEPDSMISFETMETPVTVDIIRQPSPPPVLAEVQDLVSALSSEVSKPEVRVENSSSDGFDRSEPLQLHISTTLMDNFMKLAKSNTDKNLETCGVLAGSLKNRKFYVTSLIIPKQESTSDSCQTTNEEEIFEVQDKQSLFPLGWIHTHPTQSCFMSSIDVHTHYSYQIMLPESVAIVMAPRDSTRKHGIFRLTTPGGMSVIRQCQQRGFHPHDSPPDGGPIYKTCTDVYMNPNLKFDVIDLR